MSNTDPMIGADEAEGEEPSENAGEAPEQLPAVEMDFEPGKLLEETESGAKERYDWSACTVQVVLTIHPDDGHADGRLVTIAARSHRDAPVTRTLRRNEIGTFPPALRDLLLELKALFPERERLAFERQRLAAQKAIKDEESKRQAAARRAKPAAKADKTMGGKTAPAGKPAAQAKAPTTTVPAKVVATTEEPTAQAGLFG